MKVNLRDLSEVFGQQRIYVVPPFQRQYVWKRDEQWEPLWEDIKKSAAQCLDAQRRTTGQPEQSHPADHFLGAIVIQEADPQARVQVRNLIDGQQRLVTMQLVLRSVESAFAEHAPAASRRVGHLVQNSEDYVDDDPDLKFKVHPTEFDGVTFRNTMLAPTSSSRKNDKPPIVQARDFFSTAIHQWLEEAGSNLSDRVQALEDVLQNHLKLVVIELADEDDEHLIFETLNARGTPLTDWDLTRNEILNRAQQENVSVGDLVSYFEDEYWFEEVRTGGTPRARVDQFLNYWMICRNASNVDSRPRESFRAIQLYIGKGPVMPVASDMHYVGELYMELDEEDRTDTRFGVFLRRWRIMKQRVLTPVLLRILSEAPSQGVLNRASEWIESYLVRRLICRKTGRGYYDLGLELLKVMNERSGVNLDTVVLEFLGSRETERYEWPTDDELRQAFLGERMYRGIAQTPLRMVLEGIEEGMRTEMSDAGPLPKRLSIEHFMPQGWMEHWDSPVTDDPEDDPVAIRNSLIHTMGNLTLVTKKLNASMANAGLVDKREALDTHSSLFLNKDLLSHSRAGWNEDDIRERADRMWEVARSVWPRP